jgi:hypothetical protein
LDIERLLFYFVESGEGDAPVAVAEAMATVTVGMGIGVGEGVTAGDAGVVMLPGDTPDEEDAVGATVTTGGKTRPPLELPAAHR